MSVRINLEKDGKKESGFMGFSWTLLFWGFWVPLFRGRKKDFLLFFLFFLVKIGLIVLTVKEQSGAQRSVLMFGFYKPSYILLIPTLIFVIIEVIEVWLTYYYNRHCTNSLLANGYYPEENDEYSIALLKEFTYIPYTKEELESKNYLTTPYNDTPLKERVEVLENKVDNYIATKDGLITQKVTDIATTNINQAVATAKQNVLNEIQSQSEAKVQEAVSSFNTQANTITAEKLKAIGDRSGVSLDFNWNGTQLGIKRDNETSYTYRELKGEQGIQGLRGEKGHNGVIVSETEPNKAEYDVWIKPTENGVDIGTLLQQGSQGSSDNNKLIKGTGSPKGVVQAEVNTLYLDKAKTNGAYLWLKTGNNNTDWKVIKGDTGTIEFTSKVLDGKIRIRRIDNLVILNFGGLQWDLFRLRPRAEINVGNVRKSTYNGNTALQLRLTNKIDFGQFAIPYGLRSAYPIYTPLFHDSGILLGSIFVAPNSDSNQIRFNIIGTEYADNGYVDLRCSNIIYYTDDDYPENLQNLIRGLIQ